MIPHQRELLRSAIRWVLGALLAFFILLPVLLLTACGGGGDEAPPDQPPPGVDCKAQPEKCR